MFDVMNTSSVSPKPNSSYTISIDHDWFHLYSQPLFENLSAEINENFVDRIEKSFFNEVKKSAEAMVRSEWNKKVRLCLNEIIAIKLFTDNTIVRNELQQSFGANSSITDTRKHFHLSYHLKKALLYAGKTVNDNVNDIALNVDMISADNNVHFVILKGESVSKKQKGIIHDVNDDNDDEKLNVNSAQITEFLNVLLTKSEELRDNDLLGSNKKIALAIRSGKYAFELSKHSLLFNRTNFKKTKEWQKNWISQKMPWIKQLFENRTSKSSVCAAILCLMRGIDLKSMDKEDKKIGRRVKEHCNKFETLIQHLNEQFDTFKLTHSVFERLLNEFNSDYLAFATVINVKYSGALNRTKVKKEFEREFKAQFDREPNEKECADEIEKQRRLLCNLFEHPRSISICVNDSHLFMDALQRQNDQNPTVIKFKMRYRFIPQYDETYKNEPHKAEQNVDWNEYSFECKRDPMSVKMSKESLDLKKMILHNMKGFTFNKHLKCNRFEFELFCLLAVKNKDEFIKIDEGKFDVEMDCWVTQNYEIKNYENAKKDVFEFQSLRICDEAKLTVSAFGNVSPNKYLMGFIRIRCHQNIVIEEDSSLNVNGKGYFGDDEEKGYSENMGRGQRKQTKKSKKKVGEWYFAGGGYGSAGADCFEKGKLICRGGSVYGDAKLKTMHFGSSGGKGGSLSDPVSDRGGGIIELHCHMLNNKGSIVSNGKRGQTGGRKFSGGSGGAIKIVCHTLINEGQIEANGAAGYSPHSSGGNGRIAIYCKQSASRMGSIMPKKGLHVDSLENAPITSIHNHVVNGSPVVHNNKKDKKGKKEKKKKGKKKWFGLL